MGRTKQSKSVKALPNGRSAPKKERGVYLTHEMMTSKPFRKLSGSAIKVLLEISARHNGFNNRKIVCSYKQLADNLGLGKTTVSDALKELQELGFIVCTKLGYFTGRQASTWEITFLKSEGYEPTHLWKPAEQRPVIHRPNLSHIPQDLIQEIISLSKQNIDLKTER